MAKQQKQFSKDILITNINMVINNKNKYFCILYKNKVEYIEYNDLISMSLATILNLISKKNIYLAKVTIKERTIISKPKETISRSNSSSISNCKISLDDIYEQ